MSSPRVSVVMPCYNERRFVERALNSLFAGSFPAGDMEIIAVDGDSGDGTRQILERLAWQDRRLRIVANPARTTPHALNRGIAAARGEIIVRADAHTVYPHDYVEVLVRALERDGADLVGCPADATPGADGAWARVLALGTSGPFATASPFRERTESADVDTVPFGCWRKELFKRVGLFDERLLRNQDNEHASRIRRAGGRIRLTAETRVSYLVRPTLRELFGHAATSGMWNAFTHRLYPYTFHWRHFLPGIFFCGVLAAFAALVAGMARAHLGLVAFAVCALGPYVAADLAVSTRKARAAGASWLAPLVAAVTAGYHFSYGYGVTKGWILVATGAWRRRLGATNPPPPVEVRA
ncbi:MAG TPA: glycosyltransferase family 2 protein [Polyangia bacterium]|nr:glycosyltransferase family 2 protein [Polyangia bacterium]